MNLNSLKRLNCLTSILKPKLICQHFQTKLRFATQELQEKPEEKSKSKKKLPFKTKLNEYFENNEDELKFIKKIVPSQLLRSHLSTPDSLYLIDKKVAKTIIFKIKDQLKSGNGLIIEVNPGLGFLTNELINCGCKRIEVFESKPQFLEHLLNLQLRKVNLRNSDFFNIWKYAHQDRFDNGTRVADILKNVKVKPWYSGPAMKIIGAVPNLHFIRHLIYSITFQVGIATYGRPELFFAMPSYDYHSLVAQPETGYLLYRSTSVLFQLFFDIKLLQKLPRKAFLPWQSVQRKNSRKSSDDSDYLYLVHISAKRNLPVPNDQLQALWYFIRHHMCSRKSKVIPHMERWIPGCGSRLIAASNRSKKRECFKDIGIFTQFGELIPDQILDLFKQFLAMPEFNESSFIASMESSILKLETNEESATGLESEQDITSTAIETEHDVTTSVRTQIDKDDIQTNLDSEENLNKSISSKKNKKYS